MSQKYKSRVPTIRKEIIKSGGGLAPKISNEDDILPPDVIVVDAEPAPLEKPAKPKQKKPKPQPHTAKAKPNANIAF